MPGRPTQKHVELLKSATIICNGHAPCCLINVTLCHFMTLFCKFNKNIMVNVIVNKTITYGLMFQVLQVMTKEFLELMAITHVF